MKCTSVRQCTNLNNRVDEYISCKPLKLSLEGE